MAARYKPGNLGDEKSPRDDIPYDENNSEKHNAIALRAAEKYLTPLKNDGLLPHGQGGGKDCGPPCASGAAMVQYAATTPYNAADFRICSLNKQ